jgi:hypothetical protein
MVIEQSKWVNQVKRGGGLTGSCPELVRTQKWVERAVGWKLWKQVGRKECNRENIEQSLYQIDLEGILILQLDIWIVSEASSLKVVLRETMLWGSLKEKIGLL